MVVRIGIIIHQVLLWVLLVAIVMSLGGLLFEKKQKEMFVFSLTPRKEPKEGCYPQGPLDRGMQTEDCRNRQSSVGSSNAGRRVEFFNSLRRNER